MTRAGAYIGADNLLAGGRLSLTAELDVHGPEPIVEDVLIETAALTVQRTAPCSNEGTGGVAQVDPLAATVPDLRRRQGDAAARTNPAYNWRLTLRDLTAKVPGATAGFRPGDRVPGVPTRCNMSHESQFGVPPETEWDD